MAPRTMAQLAGAFALFLAPATSLHAQSVHWAVTVQPTQNPQPIGSCAAVSITLYDSTTKDTPRRSDGHRVSMVDFDLVVTSPDGVSASGAYNGAYFFKLCGCQGAAVGTIATVTATYPAQSLTAQLQVKGAAMQISSTVALSAARGTSNPPSCNGLTKTVALAPLIQLSAAAPATATPAGRPVATFPRTSPTSPPTSVNTPPGTSGGTPLPGAQRPGRVVPATLSPATPAATTPPPYGPPPQSPGVVATPAEAIVTWSPPNNYNTPAPTGYVVERRNSSNPACCGVTSPVLTTLQWHDPVQQAGTWIYYISALYADGRRGTSYLNPTFTYAPPVAPTQFQATQVGRDTVVLTWQPVKGASYYVFGGPPGNTAIRVDSTRIVRTGVPLGPQTWQISTMYEATDPTAPKSGSVFVTTALNVVQRQYRILAEAIRVTHETTDDPWSGDGRGDEVYVSSLAELLDRKTGNVTQRIAPVLSVVHGDVAKYPSPEGVRAGTASVDGGLRQNDVVNPVLGRPVAGASGFPPMILWEGELISGVHDLLLHPVIWDVDTPANSLQRDLGGYCNFALCAWWTHFTGPSAKSVGMPQVTAAIAAPQLSVVDGRDIWLGSNGYMVHMENIDKDRPIGMEVAPNAPRGMGLVGRMRDILVVLSREKIEAALASGKSTIDVRFWDHSTAPNQAPAPVSYLGGDYTLTLRIERVP